MQENKMKLFFYFCAAISAENSVKTVPGAQKTALPKKKPPQPAAASKTIVFVLPDYYIKKFLKTQIFEQCNKHYFLFCA